MSENNTNQNTTRPDAEIQAIKEWLKSVRFKKRRVGGVDEADVWRKIGELNQLYEKLVIIDRVRSEEAPEPEIPSDSPDTEDGGEENE